MSDKPGIACYLRTSTEDQGGGLATQRAECVRFCERHGLAEPSVYEDEITGTTRLEDRPAGRRLLEDARAGRITKLVTYKLDRLGRSTLVTLTAIQALEAAGVEILCAAEPFDSTTAPGRFLISTLASVAELERCNIVARTTAGLHRRAREGYHAAGHVPYGYVLSAEKKLVPDETPLPGSTVSPAAVVRMIFEMIGGGASSQTVADRLYATGIRAPKGSDSRWASCSVRRIARNPTYRGLRVWGPRRKRAGGKIIQSECTAIVDGATWQAAQAGLARNFSNSKRNCRRDFLLRGVLRCAACGRRLIGGGGSNPVYRCTGRHPARQLRADALEAAIWKDCETIVRNPNDAVAELARKQTLGRSEQAFATKRLRDLRKQLAGKDAERERTIALHRRGLITDGEAERDLDLARQEREALAAELVTLEDAGARAREAQGRLDAAGVLLAALNRRLDAGPLSFETRRRVVLALVDRVEVAIRGSRATLDIAVTAHYVLQPPQEGTGVCRSLSWDNE
ncbi:MAG TPA: recombinase family protein [Candidatus Eisenbacteria bacterium]|jgi:site-specific DNA recombinase